MDKREYYIDLYENYKELLTDKQRKYFENYYYEDLSLNEIMSLYGVSKSLVGKTINQVEEKLISYEEKLRINKKNIELKKIISNIKDVKTKKELEDILYK